jgi:hypothetical protein
MDSSDVLRKKQTQTIFNYYVATEYSLVPTCNYSTVSTITNTYSPRYANYELRQEVLEGTKAYLSTPYTICGAR